MQQNKLYLHFIPQQLDLCRGKMNILNLNHIEISNTIYYIVKSSAKKTNNNYKVIIKNKNYYVE